MDVTVGNNGAGETQNTAEPPAPTETLTLTPSHPTVIFILFLLCLGATLAGTVGILMALFLGFTPRDTQKMLTGTCCLTLPRATGHFGSFGDVSRMATGSWPLSVGRSVHGPSLFYLSPASTTPS